MKAELFKTTSPLGLRRSGCESKRRYSKARTSCDISLFDEVSTKSLHAVATQVMLSGMRLLKKVFPSGPFSAFEETLNLKVSKAPDLPVQLQLRLLDDALDGIVIVDQQSVIRYVNRSMEALSGFTNEELHGRSLDSLIPQDGISPHSAKIAKFVAGDKPSVILGHVRELEILLKSGESCAVEMKAIDLGVCEGRRFFGAFMTDIRKRKAIEARNAALVVQLERQALSDALTGLLNRRAFEKEAVATIARAARSAAPIAVGIADIDHFKSINDRYGHSVGDSILKAVAAAILSVTRDTDIVARIGGEEFGLLFPCASIDQASQAAERLQQAVSQVRLPLENGAEVRVTISIGVSPLVGRGLDEALIAADKALYIAKSKGRNRVEVGLQIGL